MLLRPANYPDANPGKGYIVIDSRGGVKMRSLPIYRAGSLWTRGRLSVQDSRQVRGRKSKRETDVILVDFHAEATSEKYAMGWYLDNRVSAVIGTIRTYRPRTRGYCRAARPT